MTSAAWIMLAVTWLVVFGFTGRFFYKVLTLPPGIEEDDDASGDRSD